MIPPAVFHVRFDDFHILPGAGLPQLETQGRKPGDMPVNQFPVQFLQLGSGYIALYKAADHHTPGAAGIDDSAVYLPGLPEPVIRLGITKAYDKGGGGTDQGYGHPGYGQPFPAETIIQRGGNNSEDTQGIDVPAGPEDKFLKRITTSGMHKLLRV